MLVRKLLPLCTLLLVLAALFGCGSEESSSVSTVSNPPSDKQAQKPKPVAGSDTEATEPQGNKNPARSNSGAGDRGSNTAETKSGQEEKEGEQRQAKPPGDGDSKPSACGKDPTSRRCEEERNPQPPDTDPPEPPMHGDKPAVQPTGCNKPGGCGGEPDH